MTKRVEHEHLPWLGKLIGLDWLTRRMDDRFDRLERKLRTSAEDRAALEEARSVLLEADKTIDDIEPGK